MAPRSASRQEALDAVVGAVRKGRTVGEHELGFVQQVLQRDRSLSPGQRRARRDDSHHTLAEQAFGGQCWRRKRQGTGYAEAASSLDNHLRQRTQRFDVQPQRGGGKALLEACQRVGEARLREHHVHYDRQFGLQSGHEAARLGFQAICASHDAPRVGDEVGALLDQLWVTAHALEQGYAELAFQIADGLADDGLRAAERPTGGREAALVDGGNGWASFSGSGCSPACWE